jgi:hypothetical protein
MTLNKRFIIITDLPKERSSGILLQGNPVTPHRGTMVSRPSTNATPMRAGDREAIKSKPSSS